MKKNKIIQVYSEGIYIGNIIYTHRIPSFSEEEITDEIIKHFPQLKGKRWNLLIANKI